MYFMYLVFTSKCVFVPTLLRQAQNILTVYLYISILNFVVLLNDRSSRYLPMKSTIYPAQYDAKCF